MATTTTNFGWTVPSDTDLVKDGAAAIRTLGQAIDTSMADLEGGTTGQILSKTSNTDMDFTWIDPTTGDITGVTAGTGISGGGTSGTVTVTNSMATAIDAKGDLIGGTGADAFARLAVGTNGQVLTADSTQTTGLAWTTPASGGFTSLASGSLSGAAVTLNSIAGTYRDLVLVWRNVSWSAADDRFRFILNNTSTGGAYSCIQMKSISSSTANITFDHQINQVYSDNLAPSDQDSACTLRIFDYANTSADKLFMMNYYGRNDANTFDRVGITNGVFRSTSAVTRIDLQALANFSAGTYELFGVK